MRFYAASILCKYCLVVCQPYLHNTISLMKLYSQFNIRFQNFQFQLILFIANHIQKETAGCHGFFFFRRNKQTLDRANTRPYQNVLLQKSAKCNMFAKSVVVSFSVLRRKNSSLCRQHGSLKNIFSSWLTLFLNKLSQLVITKLIL